MTHECWSMFCTQHGLDDQVMLFGVVGDEIGAAGSAQLHIAARGADHAPFIVMVPWVEGDDPDTWDFYPAARLAGGKVTDDGN